MTLVMGGGYGATLLAANEINEVASIDQHLVEGAAVAAIGFVAEAHSDGIAQRHDPNATTHDFTHVFLTLIG
jgi:hypothetical protein